MKDLIKKVLQEHLGGKVVITEMAKRDWCTDFKKTEPQYHFCTAAENYIKTELEDVAVRGKRKSKKVFKDFEKGLEKFYDSVKDDPEMTKRMIRIDSSSPIYKAGKKEFVEVIKKLKPNCSKIEDAVTKKLQDFEDRVVLYFLDNEKYSNDNRLPTNYSALAVLFTKFFSKKGAFDSVTSLDLDWNKIAKEWITHSFHPYHPFVDIRPKREWKNKLGSLSFQELARIYFTNDTVFNSEEIRNSVRKVLEGVRGQGFKSEDDFELMKLKGQETYHRYARDYGFVDMFLGIDFIYKGNDGLWIPVQVKSTITEPTYKISTLGCKKYVIVEKVGKGFGIATLPKSDVLPR